MKSMKEASNVEHCESCNGEMERIFVAPHIVGASVQNAEFNYGLGQVINNKAHRAEVAKRKGLIEVGNENPDNMAKKAAQDKKERIDKIWED